MYAWTGRCHRNSATNWCGAFNGNPTAAYSSPPTPAPPALTCNTVINVDLPWNPALLEQRIARAHRMGQTQPVQVYLLVTEDTLEENLLSTLSAKRELALAALDRMIGRV